VKRSVVGSGPILCPGKSRPNKYLIKDVLPTEYWPRSKTRGLATKSEGERGGEWKWPYLEAISRGRMFLR